VTGEPEQETERPVGSRLPETALDWSQLADDTVFIIGAGHFGSRAARIIRGRSEAPVFVVDPEEQALSAVKDIRVEAISADGIEFLVAHLPEMKAANTIVPALPLHLAYEWLIRFLPANMNIQKLTVPETTPPLPHAAPASEGSTLVSYADFRCPDDCPEPVYCTVTGEKREKPLFALLRDQAIPPFQIHIVRSHQLAPGLGGYKVDDLKEIAEEVLKRKKRMWILGTACKCHGILTAFKLNDLTQRTQGHREY